MHIRVLGSAAGGGFPQWNCGCLNCRGLRAGRIRARPRTQESLAVSANGEHWFVINASPEIRAQVEGFAPLHPHAPRHTPIAAILLNNGDLDHLLGLLSLRESQPLQVYATSAVRDGFTTGNALYRTLQRFDGQLTWTELVLGVARPLTLPGGGPSGLSVTAIAIPGKLPLHLEGQRVPSAGDNVGFVIRDELRQRTLVYAPAVAVPQAALSAALQEADCLFFDGTFWSEDELVALGLGDRRATDMAHWPVGGQDGSLVFLEQLRAPRKILIHLNNTNPLLREDSDERRATIRAGVEVAEDGMEIVL